MEIHPIAYISSPFKKKFGIPRQAGLVQNTLSKICFCQPYNNADALRYIDEYDRLWLIWQFSENLVDKSNWLPLVRPPRLGGDKRAGVFATRAPYRPNNLCLSCVELVNCDTSDIESPFLIVRGADLLDATPIYDIKPYMPFSDAFDVEHGGFKDNHPDVFLEIIFSDELQDKARKIYNGCINNQKSPYYDLISLYSFENLIGAILECLECDPRPAYHEDKNRQYGFDFACFDIKFIVKNKSLQVVDVLEASD
ncbi:MAG: tRNA (N6-threonylcarbamoyladenosine(37)-N6)-methyltransferase TrmO [Coriobacteriales bacterium]|nr:tRNA (N6-threonylcarbamoyladenosine(37)-N6)-methyltransferase TrmO [Coriobacteriales bacterium]